MIKFSTGETVETIGISANIETMGGTRRSVATIKTTGIDHARASELFKEGAVWSIVDGDVTYDVWNDYTMAGPITDHRDGTLTVKMGQADTAEQVARKEADAAIQRVNLVAGRSINSDEDAAVVRAQMEAVFQVAVMDNDQKITDRNLCAEWVPGDHKVGETYTAIGQIWECFQQYNNDTFPDIRPGDPSWYTFNRPLHGKTPETAMPWVAPMGAHDIYKAGEYMVWTDGTVQHCLKQTNFSPVEQADAWEVHNG